jgi:hypothetical protein
MVDYFTTGKVEKIFPKKSKFDERQFARNKGFIRPL